MNNCLETANEYGYIPPECLNDWPSMKEICLANIQKESEMYPELLPALQRVINRFYQLWLSDREMFAVEVNNFYVNNS